MMPDVRPARPCTAELPFDIAVEIEMVVEADEAPRSIASIRFVLGDGFLAMRATREIPNAD